jgi:hypothetical protein
MNERRRDRRFHLDTQAVLKVGKKPLSGTVLNVSFHGLAVKIDDSPPPLRQLVQVELSLPSGAPFSAHCSVIRVDGPVVGLEFFGRSSNPDWDELVQGLSRASVLPPSPMTSMPTPGPGFGGALPAPPQGGSLPLPLPLPSAPGNDRPAPRPPPAPPPSRRGPPQPPAPPPAPSAADWPAPPLPPAPPPPPAPAPPPRPPPEPYNGAERRRAPRVDMRLELRLRTARSIHTAFTSSVSMTGVTVVLHEGEVAEGETIILNLIQPGTSFSFRRDGIVRRVIVVGGTRHLGVEFSSLDAMREVLFAEFMNSAYSTLHPGG